YGYDAVRRKIAETNALGAVTFYHYCSCGALESMEDALGNFTFFNYDDAGRLVQMTYADGYSLNYHYDLPGRVTNVVDSASASITNWYNNQGINYAATNAAGRLTVLRFDADDRTTNSVDANDVNLAVVYDKLGRLTARIYPDGGVERWGYMLNVSAATSYTNQIGNVT